MKNLIKISILSIMCCVFNQGHANDMEASIEVLQSSRKIRAKKGHPIKLDHLFSQPNLAFEVVQRLSIADIARVRRISGVFKAMLDDNKELKRSIARHVGIEFDKFDTLFLKTTDYFKPWYKHVRQYKKENDVKVENDILFDQIFETRHSKIKKVYVCDNTYNNDALFENLKKELTIKLKSHAVDENQCLVLRSFYVHAIKLNQITVLGAMNVVNQSNMGEFSYHFKGKIGSLQIIDNDLKGFFLDSNDNQSRCVGWMGAQQALKPAFMEQNAVVFLDDYLEKFLVKDQIEIKNFDAITRISSQGSHMLINQSHIAYIPLWHDHAWVKTSKSHKRQKSHRKSCHIL